MRVFFSKGEQRKFINKILSKISVKEAAKLCNLSERTIRDWRREKFSVDFAAVRKLCKKTKIPFHSNVKLRDDYWYTVKGSSAGGIAVFKKYGRIGGDPEYRKKKWYEWWEREGRFIDRPIFKRKLIKKPSKNEELAEFIGIMLGDGGITQRQICITLNKKDDREYIKFVSKMIRALFGLTPSINKHTNLSVLRIVVSSLNLIDFLISLGLKRGSKVKQQIDIPKWIKNNKPFAIACVRGLIDTDGSIFTHHYKVNGKWYSYKKLSFRNYSKPLIMSVYKILKNIGLNPRMAQDNDLRIDSIKDMQKYFQIIGFHNSKHLQKFKK